MIMTMTTKLGKSMKTNISLPRTTNPNTAAARFRTACAAKLLLLLLLALPVAVQAQFTYTTNNDGTLNVSGYTGGGAVTISNSVNGLLVTSIGNNAFIDHSGLTSVTIPSSVTSIGIYAFQDCSSLTSVYFQGNAPSADSSVFYEDNAIVYYLPWTTGWDAATFGGLSTAVGSQQLQAGGAGVRTNQFGFTFTGTNSQVIVEACTNLSTRVWSPVGTNTLTGGSSYFSDPHWTNYPGRFYRLRAP